MKNFQYIAGIDEAGRGPLAGPVAVGIFIAPNNFDYKILQGLRDSKKVSAKKREEIFLKIKNLKKMDKVDFAVTLVSEKYIDKNGITKAVKTKLNPKKTFIYLDGLLHAGEGFKQETIIKGDDKIPAISAASICAKVTRDIYMQKISKKFPKYGFEIHKGYGTKGHIETIKKYGLSSIHRGSFCKKFK